MKTRKYCVHVYPRMVDYENVEAKTPAEAEEKVVLAEWANDYESIDHVEVMVQCECGTDNDPENKECEDCGEKL